MKIVAYGEMMLRLMPPDFMLLEQTDQLRMSFVGTGVNLLSGLWRFGHEVALITTVPDNGLGRAAVAEARKLGISDRFIQLEGNHLGSYFVELGYGGRPTQVTYQNRVNSAFAMADANKYDFSQMLGGADYVHICGISLSLTEATRQAALNLAACSEELGKKLCFDFNYRPSLNQQNNKDLLQGAYQQILESAHIVFGSLRDLTGLLGMDTDLQLEQAGFRFMKEFGIEIFAGTMREKGKLTGFMFVGDRFYVSEPVKLQVLDRIGGGDAYACGILNGLLEGWSPQYTLEFAMASTALAHSTLGDAPRATKSQVEHYIKHPDMDLIR